MGVRTNLIPLMTATIADHVNWTYDAIRPMAVPPSWTPGQKVRGDCSKGVQYLCKWAGGEDPMDNNWSVYGNSATICAHLSHLWSLDQMQIGDIVTFGPYGNEHAAMVKELVKDAAGKVTDLRLWSFGHQGAPDEYLLSQDTRVHQLLKLPVPSEYVRPTTSVLRAKTGYFAWLQWRLGIGDWKGYGKHNKHVRPDVPHLIPLLWWKRLATYILRHHSGNKPSATPSS